VGSLPGPSGGEKGLKALLRFHHREYRGHRLVAMLEELSQKLPIPEELFEAARELDLHDMGYGLALSEPLR
jgi:HEPN domain-containing protein